MHYFNINPSIAVTAVAFLSALPTAQAAGLYTKTSPVIQVDAKNYDRLIAKSNHTSIVEFYAPWCGHCQNLKPAYEKAAKNLDGLAKVAAVNCDEDENKQLCSMMGVKGFPTLKIVRPGKKQGSKPVVEDYQGERSAKAITGAVVDKIANHVQRVTDKDIDSFLSTNNETAKAILFTEKGTTSALLRSLAIDYLGAVSFAQVRNKESKATELFGIESYPTLVLLPGGDKDGLVYEGEMKKPAMLEFLSQVGEPNPDPALAKSKGEKKSEKKDKKDKAPKASSDSTSTTSEATEATLEPREPRAPQPIPAITSSQELINKCLHPKAHICILAFAPSAHGEASEKALTSLSEIVFKRSQASNLFSIFEVNTDNEETAPVFKSLELADEVELVAVNAKRGWWRQYRGDFTLASVEDWIDAIRMNEGLKNKLPEAIVGKAEAAPEKPVETVELVAVNAKRGWWRQYRGDFTLASVEDWIDAIRMNEGLKNKLPEAIVGKAEAAPEKPVETVEVKVEEDVKVEVNTEPESASWQGAEPTPEATDAPPKHEEL